MTHWFSISLVFWMWCLNSQYVTYWCCTNKTCQCRVLTVLQTKCASEVGQAPGNLRIKDCCQCHTVSETASTFQELELISQQMECKEFLVWPHKSRPITVLSARTFQDKNYICIRQVVCPRLIRYQLSDFCSFWPQQSFSSMNAASSFLDWHCFLRTHLSATHRTSHTHFLLPDPSV